MAARKRVPARRRVPAHRTYTPELLANGQYRYEETPEPIAAIAADFGIHPWSMRRLAERKGWVRRNELPARGLTPAMRLEAEVDALAAAAAPAQALASAAAPPDPSPPLPETAPPVPTSSPADPPALDRMEAAVLKELAIVEAMRAQLGSQPLRPLDAERTARTLSSLTETLAKLARLRAGLPAQAASYEDDDMPEDIDEFRRELARRIEAFVRSRTEAPGAEAISAPAAVQG